MTVTTIVLLGGLLTVFAVAAFGLGVWLGTRSNERDVKFVAYDCARRLREPYHRLTPDQVLGAQKLLEFLASVRCWK